ncbi:hypothetical protein Lalb_Chr15g0090501 [Lupinus albus]|uniref:Uncharacterized protein n=1 Tax=Lupinus albus TaxID=3870 RepID=A0A6A4PEZ0_LUPAL|nr:hypothetical protein Lalb_Chr15g0090501 [Lupinus albus]
MSLKSSNRKMRCGGFMCHSQASAAVCMSTMDPRSVVVPRTRRHNRSVFVDDTRLINHANYSKLVDNKSVSVSAPKINNKSQDQVNGPRELQKTPTQNVFQVR